MRGFAYPLAPISHQAFDRIWGTGAAGFGVGLFKLFKARKRFFPLCDVQDRFVQTAFRRCPAVQTGLLHEGCVSITPCRLYDIGHSMCTDASWGQVLPGFGVQPLELLLPIEQLRIVHRLHLGGAVAGGEYAWRVSHLCSFVCRLAPPAVIVQL